MKKLFVLIVGLAAIVTTQAQRTCATDAVNAQMMQDDPQYAARRQSIETFTQQFAASGSGRSQRSTITIPVVIHVIYSNAAGNISDAQIQSQIRRLNLDYNKQNADTGSIPGVWKPVAANCGINFCLAARDPNNLPTTGIVRKQTTVTSWSQNNAVKSSAQGGDDAWPSSSYLNIWVCDLGSSLLGYSTFPGGQASLDGCVILNTAFGDAIGSVRSPYNLGRTVTHEVGHWLNLYHTFQGGCTGAGDQCNDTPPTATAVYGCNTFPLLGTGCSTTSPGIMFMNYMDYGEDLCLYMFTNDQNTRIQSLFTSGGSRVAITNSLGCVPLSGGLLAFFTADHNNVCAGQSVNFTNTSYDTPTVFHWSFPGGVPDTFSGIAPPPVTYNTPGTYAVTLTVGRDTFVNTRTVASYITVSGSTLLPLVEGFQSVTFPPTGWTITNPDNRTTWAQSTTVGGYSSSSGCVFMNNAATGAGGSITGQRDFLYSPILDFRYGADADTKLKFDYAYARKNRQGRNSYDTLTVIISTDCGATWSPIWTKIDSLLATSSAFVNTGTFTPTATQWTTDSSISLANYAGMSSVQFGFVNYNGRGNAFYLDNINIANTKAVNVGIGEAESNIHLNVIPNPATDKFTLNFEMDRQQSVEASLYDMIGQRVWSKDMGTVHAASETISIAGLTPGIYIVRVKAGERTYSSRLVKQ